MRSLLMILVAITSAQAAPAFAQTWPTDLEWRVLRCGGSPSFDPVADEPGATNERDIVGDANQPALYFHVDDTHMFFRMRVDADPISGGEFRPFGWAVEFDIDGSPESYELFAGIDGISNPEQVVLMRNTVQRTANDPADPPEVTVTMYPVSSHARGVPAEDLFASNFGGDPDFFVDMALDRSDLEAEGVSGDTELVLVMGTSSNASSINADIACNDGGSDASELTLAGTDAVASDDPPPVDADGDGLDADAEDSLGTDPDNADTDGDGFDDGVEVTAGTDPLDPSSFPSGDGTATSGGSGSGSGSTSDDEPGYGIRGGGGPAGCSVGGAAAGLGEVSFATFLALIIALARRLWLRRRVII